MRKLHDLLISLSQAQDVTIITRVHFITLNFCCCIILVLFSFCKCALQRDSVLYLFQVGADNVRALYKRTLELNIEYKRLLIKKTRLEIEKLEYEKR